MSRILITGATGFIGRALGSRLGREGREIRAAVRVRPLPGDERFPWEWVECGEIGPATPWRDALSGVAAIVHLAARVHVVRESVADPLTEFRWINVAGTLNLARQAAAAGVRRFVFASSIKVNGEETPPGRPFNEDDPPAPQDAYALSKWEAEQGLMALAAETGMEVVIIRAPLVYGPGVKANFLAMMHWVARGLPFPFAVLDNRRSLVGLDNLVDFIVVALKHPAAANEIFLVSDGEDLSTPELLMRLGGYLGVRVTLVPVPLPWLRWGAALIGRSDLFMRLCTSLQTDGGKARTLLGWTPPVTVDAELSRTVHHYRKERWK